MVLLTAWMPFNNGLRPEPIIALGSLITYVLIERSMCASRLTPAALAVITAAFTLGVQPTGLIAVAALVAGGRPILRILVHRHRLVGTWPLVAPMLAAGSVILTVVFADRHCQRCWRPPGFALRSVRARPGTPRTCATTTSSCPPSTVHYRADSAS
jgi:arabinosyltransferase B